MITEEKMKAAAEEAAQVLLESLPEEAAFQHTFSKQFTKKMKKLVWGKKHPVIYYGAKSVACVLGVLLLSGTLLLTCSEDARAAVRGWFKELHGEAYFGYYFEGQSSAGKNLTVYEVSCLPEGYLFYEKQDSQNRTTVLYKDSAGYLAEFTYMTVDDKAVSGVAIGADNQNYEYVEVEIGGHRADCYISTDDAHTSSIVWSNEKDIFFVLSARLEKEALIKWAESVVEAE